MRLQEVLKERETEISVLEASFQDQAYTPSTKEPGNLVKDVETSAMNLSPRTLNHFDDIRKTMSNGNDYPTDASEGNRSVSESDESLDRLNELMLWVPPDVV